jgi:hypothetical protein
MSLEIFMARFHHWTEGMQACSDSGGDPWNKQLSISKKAI